MGFFDLTGSNFLDPNQSTGYNMPLLGLMSALGQASAPSRLPVSSGQVWGDIAQGLMQGQQYQQQQQTTALENQQRAMAMAMMKGKFKMFGIDPNTGQPTDNAPAASAAATEAQKPSALGPLGFGAPDIAGADTSAVTPTDTTTPTTTSALAENQKETQQKAAAATAGLPGAAPAPSAARFAPPPIPDSAAGQPLSSYMQPTPINYQDYNNRVFNAESGNRLNARNPASSAADLAQFTNSTWLKTMRPLHPELANMSDQQFLSLRTDPHFGPLFNAEANQALGQKNGAVLQAHNIPVNDGTLYGAHVLGAQGAVDLFSAPAGTPVSSLISPAAIRANPKLLRGTNTDVANRFASKMDQTPVSAPAGSAATATAGPDETAAMMTTDANGNQVPISGWNLTGIQRPDMSSLQGYINSLPAAARQAYAMMDDPWTPLLKNMTMPRPMDSDTLQSFLKNNPAANPYSMWGVDPLTGMPVEMQKGDAESPLKLGQEIAKTKAEAIARSEAAVDAINQTIPGYIDQQAALIASYRAAPMTTTGGRANILAPTVMAKVMALNPNYDQKNYNAYGKLVTGFDSGKQADQMRFINNAFGHSELMSQYAQALTHGPSVTLTQLAQRVQTELGISAPTTFNALKNFVVPELVKSVVPSGGTEADRAAVERTLNAASSPEQIAGAIKMYQQVLGRQMQGLAQQYSVTGNKDFEKYVAPDLVPTFRSALPLPPQAVSQLQEGRVTTFGNGQKWMLQNGQPVRVQ